MIRKFSQFFLTQIIYNWNEYFHFCFWMKMKGSNRNKQNIKFWNLNLNKIQLTQQKIKFRKKSLFYKIKEVLLKVLNAFLHRSLIEPFIFFVNNYEKWILRKVKLLPNVKYHIKLLFINLRFENSIKILTGGSTKRHFLFTHFFKISH